MQEPTPIAPAKPNPTVELVRLYTEPDHPWLGLVALALRMGLMGTVAALVVGLAKLVIEGLLQMRGAS